MKKILIIAKKEFLDMFRDRRTMIRMILIPLLIFPLIMNVVTRIQSSVSEKQAAEKLTVGFIQSQESIPAIKRMSQEPNFEFTSYTDTTQLRKDVVAKKINLGLIFSPTYLTDYTSGKTAQYSVIFRGADFEVYERLQKLLQREDSLIVDSRMQELGNLIRFWHQQKRMKLTSPPSKKFLPNTQAACFDIFSWHFYLWVVCYLPLIFLLVKKNAELLKHC